MKMPPFLLGAALLFWGWQAGFLWAALPMALIYEGARFVPWRWNLRTANFRNTSHLCTALLVGVLIYLFNTDRSFRLIFDFFQWLPIICFPLAAALAYSTSDRLDLRALLFFKEREGDSSEPIPIDIVYPYFAICILSTSAANVRELSFYLGMLMLVVLVLWSVRSPRFSLALWLCLIIMAASIGVVAHTGIHQVQLAIERKTYRWFRGLYRPDADPLQRSTAIGDIGTVKLSNRIALRVKPESRQPVPQLLRRATYNKYSSGIWATSSPNFALLEPEADGTTWQLAPQSERELAIAVAESYQEGVGLLNLPDGSYQVERLPVEKAEQNQYNTVKVLGEPGLFAYRVIYDPEHMVDSLPTEYDLQIPSSERPTFERLVSQLDLANRPPQEIIQRVADFFATFRYSLELVPKGRYATPLSAFLFNHQSGHCEYFATATSLLLRAVGIPTRYAIGYSVHEFSRLENQYIVRHRHAHAWTLVYIDDRWQVLDTTPSVWRGLEDAAASDLQFIRDIWSLLWFKIAQGTAFAKNLTQAKYFWWFVIPVVAIITIGWLYSRGKIGGLSIQRISRKQDRDYFVGQDSEAYQIEKALNELGYTRDRSETWKNWLHRLQQEQSTSDLIQELQAIVELHYRYRFDPQGIKATERDQLKSSCEAWLDKYQNLKDEG